MILPDWAPPLVLFVTFLILVIVYGRDPKAKGGE
jgi:hypothetical protein